PNLVALSIDAFAQPIDPTETKRLIDRFRPGYAGAAAALPVKPNPLLGLSGMAAFEPGPKLCRGREEDRLFGSVFQYKSWIRPVGRRRQSPAVQHPPAMQRL